MPRTTRRTPGPGEAVGHAPAELPATVWRQHRSRRCPATARARVTWQTQADWAPLSSPRRAARTSHQRRRTFTAQGEVDFSALSDAADLHRLHQRPEDGAHRHFTSLWGTRSGAPPEPRTPRLLGSPANSQATLRPFATGDYTVRPHGEGHPGHLTSTTLRFVWP